MLRRMLPTTSLRSVLLLSLGMAAYSGLAVWKEHGRFARYADFPSGLEATLSLVIGLLLAFRANRAFDRWWEGRTLWGTLVNACRNLAVKANNVIVERDNSLQELERLLVAFPYALRDHLRDGARLNKLPGIFGSPHPNSTFPRMRDSAATVSEAAFRSPMSTPVSKSCTREVA